ncbi:MAG: expansin-like protein, partial [bacterium]
MTRVSFVSMKMALRRAAPVLAFLGLAGVLYAVPPSTDYNACSPTWFGNTAGGGCGPCSSGTADTATYYSLPSLSGCEYSQASIPSAYAAVNGDMYLANDLCGACVLVMNESNDGHAGASTTVMITDECPAAGNPSCANGDEHLDLSQSAFEAINGGSTSQGEISIKWEMTPC